MLEFISSRETASPILARLSPGEVFDIADLSFLQGKSPLLREVVVAKRVEELLTRHGYDGRQIMEEIVWTQNPKKALSLLSDSEIASLKKFLNSKGVLEKIVLGSQSGQQLYGGWLGAFFDRFPSFKKWFEDRGIKVETGTEHQITIAEALQKIEAQTGSIDADGFRNDLQSSSYSLAQIRAVVEIGLSNSQELLAPFTEAQRNIIYDVVADRAWARIHNGPLPPFPTAVQIVGRSFEVRTRAVKAAIQVVDGPEGLVFGYTVKSGRVPTLNEARRMFEVTLGQMQAEDPALALAIKTLSASEMEQLLTSASNLARAKINNELVSRMAEKGINKADIQAKIDETFGLIKPGLEKALLQAVSELNYAHEHQGLVLEMNGKVIDERIEGLLTPVFADELSSLRLQGDLGITVGNLAAIQALDTIRQARSQVIETYLDRVVLDSKTGLLVVEAMGRTILINSPRLEIVPLIPISIAEPAFPVKAGFVRLYRGVIAAEVADEFNSSPVTNGPIKYYTDSYSTAGELAGPGGKVYYLDFPKKEADTHIRGFSTMGRNSEVVDYKIPLPIHLSKSREYIGLHGFPDGKVLSDLGPMGIARERRLLLTQHTDYLRQQVEDLGMFGGITQDGARQISASFFKLFLLVRPPGIEPGTFSLKGSCSTS